MRNIAMHSILNRILMVFGCVLLAMACSTSDDSPVVEPDGNETVEETDSETENEIESESGGETDSENETENDSETGEVENSMPNLIELVNSEDQLSLFEAALAETDLADILMGEGPYTVFAPTDAAVEQLFVLLGDDYDSFDDFDNIIEQQILEEILLGHVIEGKIASTDFVAGTFPTLLPEDSIELIPEEDTFIIRDASEILTNFVSFDLEASNGTVHTIDKILIPQKAFALVE